MARARQKGTPGRAYPNRKDLRKASKQLPVKAATGQPYGVRKQQIEAQRAQPLPAAPTPDFASLLQAAEAFDPGERLPLDRPTERPDEPLTAGLPIGAGPGPEALDLSNFPRFTESPLNQLRAIYQRTGSEAIRELIEEMETRG
jgi:hypothetical protein